MSDRPKLVALPMTSDEGYTPSMDVVRNRYSRIMKPDGTVALWSRRQKEFDRWLAAHDRELREEIARDIEAFGDSSGVGAYGDYGPPAIAVSDAARIARGEGQTDE